MNDLSRLQLRLIIFYEWSCGNPAAETVTKIGKVFGETTITDRTVRNWFARFQSGEKCFQDKDRCGRPTAALNNDMLRDAVKERPDVTTRELETMLGCSHQTISNHLHDLGYRRVLARWELNWDTVPHPLYLPDIAPSDYHLFRPLKLFLKEKRFAKYEDLKMAVFDFFDSQSAAFWKNVIDDLPERWLTVVTNHGQYIVD
uniref:HTH_48 domain-containing protein n=1 Tax=Caenorhabditis japonica TaxID=281687 RepID=A0A8R1IX19_CAEJA